MSDKIRIVLIWIVIVMIGIAAFILALNVTTESMDAGNSVTDVTIELNPETECTKE